MLPVWSDVCSPCDIDVQFLRYYFGYFQQTIFGFLLNFHIFDRWRLALNFSVKKLYYISQLLKYHKSFHSILVLIFVMNGV